MSGHGLCDRRSTDILVCVKCYLQDCDHVNVPCLASDLLFMTKNFVCGRIICRSGGVSTDRNVCATGPVQTLRSAISPQTRMSVPQDLCKHISPQTRMSVPQELYKQ